MPTTYKVLGQTTSTAPAPIFTNLLYDPNFKQSTLTTSYGESYTDRWRPIGINTSTYWQSYATNGNIWNATPIAASGYVGLGYHEHKMTSTLSGTFTSVLAYDMPVNFSQTTIYSYGQYLDFRADNTITTGSTIYLNGAFNPQYTSQTPSMTTKMYFYSSNATTILQTSTWTSTFTASGWQSISLNTTLPAGAIFANFEHKVSWVNPQAGTYFRFDNMRVHAYSSANTSTTQIDGSYAWSPSRSYAAPFDGSGTGGWWLSGNSTGGTAEINQTIIVGAGVQTVVYTVPASSSAVVSSLVVTNPNTSATTYRISVLPSGQTLAQKHFIAFDEAIAANSSVTRTVGMTLAAGDKLQISSADTDARLSATAFGSES